MKYHRLMRRTQLACGSAIILGLVAASVLVAIFGSVQ